MGGEPAPKNAVVCGNVIGLIAQRGAAGPIHVVSVAGIELAYRLNKIAGAFRRHTGGSQRPGERNEPRDRIADGFGHGAQVPRIESRAVRTRSLSSRYLHSAPIVMDADSRSRSSRPSSCKIGRAHV